MSEAESIWEHHLKSELNDAGYTDIQRLSNSLQGCVYRAIQTSTKAHVVIKATKKELHDKSLCLFNNQFHKVQENILSEGNILKHLTTKHDRVVPKSIVKFVDLLGSNVNYYLVMEHFGTNLFQFIIKAHQLIELGKISIEEWHKVTKCIFKQMIESVAYIHKNNCCHYDLSLENYVISDVRITELQSGKLEFNLDSIQIKMIDFGLAELFDNKNGAFLSNKFVGKTHYKSPEVKAKKGTFDAKQNDIFCIGVCLFLMLFGNHPWNNASNEDPSFHYIFVENNGNIGNALKVWNKYSYINNNEEIINLFQSVFQYEKKRICLENIRNHAWLK